MLFSVDILHCDAGIILKLSSDRHNASINVTYFEIAPATVIKAALLDRFLETLGNKFKFVHSNYGYSSEKKNLPSNIP